MLHIWFWVVNRNNRLFWKNKHISKFNLNRVSDQDTNQTKYMKWKFSIHNYFAIFSQRIFSLHSELSNKRAVQPCFVLNPTYTVLSLTQMKKVPTPHFFTYIHKWNNVPTLCLLTTPHLLESSEYSHYANCYILEITDKLRKLFAIQNELSNHEEVKFSLRSFICIKCSLK